jgi:phospholipid transport system transporter-binding protein
MISNVSYANSCCSIAGELNFASVMLILKETLPLFEKEPTASILVDLAKVTFINSAGIALVIEWVKCAQKFNKKIIFKNIPKELQAIAQLIQLNFLFAET